MAMNLIIVLLKWCLIVNRTNGPLRHCNGGFWLTWGSLCGLLQTPYSSRVCHSWFSVWAQWPRLCPDQSEPSRDQPVPKCGGREGDIHFNMFPLPALIWTEDSFTHIHGFDPIWSDRVCRWGNPSCLFPPFLSPAPAEGRRTIQRHTFPDKASRSRSETRK